MIQRISAIKKYRTLGIYYKKSLMNWDIKRYIKCYQTEETAWDNKSPLISDTCIDNSKHKYMKRFSFKNPPTAKRDLEDRYNFINTHIYFHFYKGFVNYYKYTYIYAFSYIIFTRLTYMIHFHLL